MVVMILDLTYHLSYSLVLSVFIFHIFTQELFKNVYNLMQCVRVTVDISHLSERLKWDIFFIAHKYGLFKLKHKYKMNI